MRRRFNWSYRISCKWRCIALPVLASNFPLQTDSLFQTVPGGGQLAQIQDANGCLVADSFQIASPSPLSVVLQSFQEPICTGDSNGTASYMVTGGVAPYAHSWSLGQNNGPAASLLPAGPVVYTVADSNGCVASDTLTLLEPAPMSAGLMAQDPPCSDGVGGPHPTRCLEALLLISISGLMRLP